MNNVTKEQRYLKLIAEIKWGKGFKCRKCRHKQSYIISKLFLRRCKKCDYKESAVYKTAFEGSKLSVVIKLKMLIRMQEYHYRYQDYLKSRLGVEALSKEFKVNTNTIGLFFKNLYAFIDKEDSDAPDSFVHGLKDESKRIYEEVFHLLFYKELGTYEPRKEDEILHKLVTNEYPDRYA